MIPLEYELEVRNATLLYEIWSIEAKYECHDDYAHKISQVKGEQDHKQISKSSKV